MDIRNIRKLVAVILVITSLITLSSCGKKLYKQKEGNNAVDAALAISYEAVKTDCPAENYIMDIKLDTENQTVSGKTTVKLTNESAESLNQLCFNFYAVAITKKSAITAVRDSATGKNLSFSADKKNPAFITIDLENSFAPDESKTIELDFTSVIPDTECRYGYHDYENGRMYHLMHCFPQIAFFDNGEWVNSTYIEAGESLYNEMSDYSVTLTAPADYVVLASGKNETVNGKTTIEAKNVREIAITACNFATVLTKVVNGVEFNLLKPEYNYDDKSVLADLYAMTMDVAIESVKIFSEKVGEYIYDEIDIIPMTIDESYGVGGMEMPGYIQVSIPGALKDSSNYDEKSALYQTINMVCHEMGHQWFYCAVGNDQANEPWLDESFTSYLENYFMLNARDFYSTADKLFRNVYNEPYIESDYSMYANYGDPADLFSDKDSDICYINLPADLYSLKVYSGIVYDSGSDFLTALEKTMGEKKFFDMLSDWYNSNKNHVVDGYAFIQHLMKYDSSDAVKEIVNTYISDEYLR
ncbi:MAG: hypothetical protein J6Q94_07705 [Clostridia bacterium]|nr:hypothetical protein [Clostridia bacterium]